MIEQMVELVERGHDREWVFSELTLTQIGDLYKFSARIEARNIVQGTYQQNIAMNGNVKGIQKFLAPFEKLLKSSSTDGKQKGKGLAAFLSRVGQGI